MGEVPSFSEIRRFNPVCPGKECANIREARLTPTYCWRPAAPRPSFLGLLTALTGSVMPCCSRPRPLPCPANPHLQVIRRREVSELAQQTRQICNTRLSSTRQQHKADDSLLGHHARAIASVVLLKAPIG